MPRLEAVDLPDHAALAVAYGVGLGLGQGVELAVHGILHRLRRCIMLTTSMNYTH